MTPHESGARALWLQEHPNVEPSCWDMLDQGMRDWWVEKARPVVEAVQGSGKPPEVRYVDLTTGEKHVLDEVVAFNATFHLEAMDSNHWWMAITSGGKTVHVNLYTARRALILARADEEDA